MKTQLNEEKIIKFIIVTPDFADFLPTCSK